jgi:zinc transporter, ZIP family
VPAVAEVALAGLLTAVATGLGALPVGRVGPRAEEWQPFLLGAAAAAMTVVSFLGLLVPAVDEGSTTAVLAGFAIGVAFLFVARELLRRHGLHQGRGVRAETRRRATLVVLVLFMHSLPEGFAIGSAWASGTEGLGVFVLVAIALQNVPEGTVTAIPMALAGASRLRQVATAIGTSLPQPVGAVVAFLLVDEIDALLPVSFAFAAGAMLSLVAVDVAPQAWRAGGRRRATAGAIAGAAVMVASAVLLDVS